jgi:hypothetical protein
MTPLLCVKPHLRRIDNEKFGRSVPSHPREGGDPSLGLPLRDALPMFRVSGLPEKCQKKTGIAPGFFMSVDVFV